MGPLTDCAAAEDTIATKANPANHRKRMSVISP
jgi:hypothetical protein